jgi:hypothetical protein
MKVGFYDKKNHKLLEVEKWEEGLQGARMASLHLSQVYQSGAHRMPSPIWCVWGSKDELDENGEQICSIFLLDEVMPPEKVLDKAQLLMRAWG